LNIYSYIFNLILTFLNRAVIPTTINEKQTHFINPVIPSDAKLILENPTNVNIAYSIDGIK